MSEKLSKKIKNDLYYDYLIKDIINNKNYSKIKGILHHGSTDRYTHCLSVSYFAYRLAKIFGGDLRVIARSGLLHDFYYENACDYRNKYMKIKYMIKEHPLLALKNAKNEFKINLIEENAIQAHMYPLCLCIPKYKESWIISLADKIVSIGEASHKLKYSVTAMTLFIVNWLFK